MTNENNYIGATITLVGFVATDPRYPAYDKQGKRGFKEIPVAINEGYKKDGEFIQTGTTWYTISIHEDKLQELSDIGEDIVKGAKIRLDDAKQEVREYTNKDGDEKLGITLSYGTLSVLEPPKGSTTRGGADDDEEPF